MALLAPLAALLGIEVDALVARLKRNAIVLAVVALFATIAGVFALVAANVALTELVGPLFAPLIIAGSAGLIALLVWLGSTLAERRRQRLASEKRKATDTTALVTTAAVTALPMFLKNRTLRLLAVPAGAMLAYQLLGRRREDTADARDT